MRMCRILSRMMKHKIVRMSHHKMSSANKNTSKVFHFTVYRVLLYSSTLLLIASTVFLLFCFSIVVSQNIFSNIIDVYGYIEERMGHRTGTIKKNREKERSGNKNRRRRGGWEASANLQMEGNRD